MKQIKIVNLIILITFLLNSTTGLYIAPLTDKLGQNKLENTNDDDLGGKWSTYQRKLGLTNEKLELLKSQKNEQVTIDLIKRYIEENPKHVVAATERINHQEPANPFLRVYHALAKQLKNAKNTMKTSLNFELADGKTEKSHKRSRRKIAVKMVSDLPVDKIDELLNMFNKQHMIDTQDGNGNPSSSSNDNVEYSDLSSAPSISSTDPDYMYENLYEDEEDLAIPAKSNHNSEFGSFQDLILQAKRNQWHREIEETKLHNHFNEHFV